MDRSLIEQYAAGPELLRKAAAGLSSQQLLAHPVPGTWSIQQIIMHLVDSDLVASDRMKRVIAEERPALIGYDESKFAARLFYERQPVDEAISLFSLNRAFTARILRALPEESFARAGVHNERGELTLATLVSDYVDHLAHHLAFLEKKRAMLQA